MESFSKRLHCRAEEALHSDMERDSWAVKVSHYFQGITCLLYFKI